MFGFVVVFLNLLVSKLCFLSSSMQSHVESSRMFIKNQIVDHLCFYVDVSHHSAFMCVCIYDIGSDTFGSLL